jgi:hypothetical protein
VTDIELRNKMQRRARGREEWEKQEYLGRRMLIDTPSDEELIRLMRVGGPKQEEPTMSDLMAKLAELEQKLEEK